MKFRRRFVALVVLSLGLSACGGGGGSDSDTASPPPSNGGGTGTPTYGDRNLPGRLIVTDLDAPTRLFDLRSGLSTSSPWNSSARTGWSVATGAGLLARTDPGPNGTTVVTRVKPADGTTVGNPLPVAGDFNRPKYSPDGRYMMTFYQPASDTANRRLTIVDAATGNVVKRGSTLDGKVVTASPAAWLPNGNYVYLNGRTLYESSPTSPTDTVRATLTALPDNSVTQNNIDVVSEGVYLTASPDGTRIAFNWLQRRGSVENDVQLWIANVDGTGLRPLTAPPDANSALAYQYGSLTWSPDGQWIAGVLYMGTSAGTPITLPPATFPDGSAVAGTTAGCNYNPVFVLPASADRVAIGWPAYDARYSVKVRKADGTGGQWMSACGNVHWIE